MFDLRFINVAADGTYCVAAAKATRNLLVGDDAAIAQFDVAETVCRSSEPDCGR
jgi:cob(I)alamin adenosyltransferase